MRASATFSFCLVLAASSLQLAAQNVPATKSPLAACGDAKITFNVLRGETGAAIAQPSEGKAVIYIIELVNLHDTGRRNRPTIRQGINGAWLGATQGFTYLSTSVGPGEQHLCSRWQSQASVLSDQISLYNFNAVAGQTYFFRAQVYDTGGFLSIDLEPVSEDEGRFLVSEAARSVSKPKS